MMRTLPTTPSNHRAVAAPSLKLAGRRIVVDRVFIIFMFPWRRRLFGTVAGHATKRGIWTCSFPRRRYSASRGLRAALFPRPTVDTKASQRVLYHDSSSGAAASAPHNCAKSQRYGAHPGGTVKGDC